MKLLHCTSDSMTDRDNHKTGISNVFANNFQNYEALNRRIATNVFHLQVLAKVIKNLFEQSP